MSKLIFFQIIFFHILIHYFSLERRSFGADTFADRLRSIKTGKINFIDYFTLSPDRPLNFIFIDFQNSIIFNNEILSLIFLIFSTVLLTIIVYLIIYQITKNKEISFLLTIIYDLFPNKLEIFHNIVFLNINFVYCIYLLSFLFFIQYINKNTKIYLLVSIFCYSISVFWYEIGFFLPLLFYFYLIFFEKKLKNKLFIFAPYILLGLFYLSLRFLISFFYDINEASHYINFSLLFNSIIEVFNFIAGKYIIKYIVYGIYQFFKISYFYFFIIIFLDFIFIMIVFKMFDRIKFDNLNKKLVIFSILIIFIPLLPIFALGSSAGRHFVIPSIGLSIILLTLFFSLIKNNFKQYFIIIFSFAIIINQGNAWTQTNTMRIEKDIANTILNNKDEILNSKYIVFDASSFQNKIEHALVNNEQNILNTYFGFQLFEEWGIKSMIRLLINTDDIKILFAVKPLQLNNNEDKLTIDIRKNKGYRKFEKFVEVIENNDVFIIDYNKVYNNNSSTFFKIDRHIN